MKSFWKEADSLGVLIVFNELLFFKYLQKNSSAYICKDSVLQIGQTNDERK
jgi:hypothetical protein